MSTRILFVCLGNICRSPAAEGVLRTLLPGVETDSAGTSDWHLGEPPCRPMVDAAAARGYDLSRLKARQLKRGDFGRFDLIIGMDDQNIADIERLRPEGSSVTVAKFTDYAPETGAAYVPDAYYTRDFDGALDLIEACTHGLIRSLTAR